MFDRITARAAGRGSADSWHATRTVTAATGHLVACFDVPHLRLADQLLAHPQVAEDFVRAYSDGGYPIRDQSCPLHSGGRDTHQR